jgi:hypothetical protein
MVKRMGFAPSELFSTASKYMQAHGLGGLPRVRPESPIPAAYAAQENTQ